MLDTVQYFLLCKINPVLFVVVEATLCRSARWQVRLGTVQSCFCFDGVNASIFVGMGSIKVKHPAFSFSMASNAAFSAEVESFLVLFYHLEGQVWMSSVFNFVI